MARYEEKVVARVLAGDALPACPAGRGPACPAPEAPADGVYERWERAIARLQGVLSCSDQCPLADHLLAVIADLGHRRTPLAEACPELDPTPRRRKRPPAP